MTGNEPSTTPVSIHADREGGTLTLDWADGHRTTHGVVALRWLCPCAFCRGEAGQPGWLDSRPTLTPDQTRLVDVQLVGQYAIAPLWGDGHHTGFYTFSLLRDRCPCAEDSGRRARGERVAAAATDRLDHGSHSTVDPAREDSHS